MALVLNRKLNERILIGDNIVVTVAGIRGSKVSISIDAPKEVTVLRSEVQEKKNKAREAANEGMA